MTNTGIYTRLGHTKWEQIESHRWKEPVHELSKLIVETTTWPSFFGARAVSIPADHKDAVNELLVCYGPDAVAS